MKRFTVVGLYGKNKYDVIFANSGVSIMIGPNGSGKTTILKLIDFFFSKSHAKLIEIDFASLEIEVKNNFVIVNRHINNKGIVCLEYFINNGKLVETYSKSNITTVASMIRNNNRYRRYSDTEVIDLLDGVVYSFYEFAELMYDELPEKIKSEVSVVPAKIMEIIKEVNVVFISANRLQTNKNDYNKRYYGDDQPRHIDTVNLYAEQLKNNLQIELSKYANFSQSLDEEFPHKVIDLFRKKKIPVESLNVDLIEEVNFVRQKHIGAGIIESNIDTIKQKKDDSFTDPQIVRVMNLYYDDMMKKLNTLNPISNRITLYMILLNEKFNYGSKKISVNSQNGIVCHNINENTESSLELSMLSSGEQQEIILLYDLIFKVKDGDVVLIDEPEISLHVKWQRQFLSDIESIMALNNFKTLVATHSPQIIGSRNEDIINLGSVE